MKMPHNRKGLKVCVYVHGSSPQEHDPRKHDWRPIVCRKKGCLGFIKNCKTEIVHKFKTKEDIRKMIAYLRKLKEHGEVI